jgi:hypothetical protein
MSAVGRYCLLDSDYGHYRVGRITKDTAQTYAVLEKDSWGAKKWGSREWRKAKNAVLTTFETEAAADAAAATAEAAYEAATPAVRVAEDALTDARASRRNAVLTALGLKGPRP